VRILELLECYLLNVSPIQHLLYVEVEPELVVWLMDAKSDLPDVQLAV
jgi:hypothetical protein